MSFHANQPAPVPDALIDALQQRCDKAGILLPPDDLQEGESVTINDGAFADFTGAIEKILSDDRIRILFEFMGQEIRVDVKSGNIGRSAKTGDMPAPLASKRLASQLAATPQCQS